MSSDGENLKNRKDKYAFWETQPVQQFDSEGEKVKLTFFLDYGGDGRGECPFLTSCTGRIEPVISTCTCKPQVYQPHPTFSVSSVSARILFFLQVSTRWMALSAAGRPNRPAQDAC